MEKGTVVGPLRVDTRLRNKGDRILTMSPAGLEVRLGVGMESPAKMGP